MPKLALPVTLTEPEQAQLQEWVRAQYTPQQVVLRARIVLCAAQGMQDLEIANQLSVNRHTAGLWRRRFRQEGLDAGWEIAPGRGRKPTYPDKKVAAVVKASLGNKTPKQTHSGCPT